MKNTSRILAFLEADPPSRRPDEENYHAAVELAKEARARFLPNRGGMQRCGFIDSSDFGGTKCVAESDGFLSDPYKRPRNYYVRNLYICVAKGGDVWLVANPEAALPALPDLGSRRPFARNCAS